VQRRLTGLGFDTKVTGKFDEATRAVITRWQAARGYPKSGYLNKLQHKALLTEIVSATTSASSGDDGGKPARRRTSGGGGGGGHRYHGGGGGADPAGVGRFMGGVVGGIFR
jgi:peptidoglycan hydrolase-like protein with peptidoglycan-binding domain